jgi:hypothetical protein
VSLCEGIDATTPAGKLHLHILGAIAEFERSRIAERVRAGLQRARAQGRRLGRPKSDLPVDRLARGRFAIAVRSGRRARRLARDDQALAPGSENPRRHGDGFAPRAACFPTRWQSSGWAHDSSVFLDGLSDVITNTIRQGRRS